MEPVRPGTHVFGPPRERLSSDDTHFGPPRVTAERLSSDEAPRPVVRRPTPRR